MAGEYAAWFELLPLEVKQLFANLPVVDDPESLDGLPCGTVIQARSANTFDAFTGSRMTLFKNGDGEWRVLDIVGSEVIDRGWGVAEPMLPVLLIRLGYADESHGPQ